MNYLSNQLKGENMSKMSSRTQQEIRFENPANFEKHLEIVEIWDVVDS